MLVNLDAGERDDETEALWESAHVLNVACGGHAGSASSMRRLAAFCAPTGRPDMGAHPSYPDRDGFGRRSMPMDADRLRAAVEEQCGVLVHAARAEGVPVGWLKPHGALYHDVARDSVLAQALLDGATSALGPRVAVIGPTRGALLDAARQRGLRYLREGFADRRYDSEGGLVPRSEPDALIDDPERAARQALSLTQVDTIGVHGDTPHAVLIARAVRRALS